MEEESSVVFTSLDPNSGHIVYAHDEVYVHAVGPHRQEETVFSGKLTLNESDQGVFLYWQPVEEVKNVTGPIFAEGENLDWEELSPTGAVGYKPNRLNSIDGVEIKSSPVKMPTSISFDLNDVRSYKCTNASDNQTQLSFFLKDGTTLPSFHISKNEFKCFTQILEKYLTFKKSKKDKNWYLVSDKTDKKKTFGDLRLREQPKYFMSKFFQDPYSTTMVGFSKVTNLMYDYLISNPETSDHPEEEIEEFLRCNLARVEITQEEPDYEIITQIKLPLRTIVERCSPLTAEEWAIFKDADGVIKDFDGLRNRIFKGGISSALRPEVWKFLLGSYDFNLTYKEREVSQKEKQDYYYRMKAQWKTITPEQESRFSGLRERRNLVEKDVSRTDRTHPFFAGDNNPHVEMLYDILMTYCMYNFDLGYVQGMSDLLSPILVVMQNEADSFWCFVGLLEKVGINFEMDQQGMKLQLQNLYNLMQVTDPHFCDYLASHDSGNMYFCFRWLLVLFKRDFNFQDVMRLWEVLWSELPCKNFHLLICLAILDTQKDTIMENKFGLTEILKHVNDLAYHIKLDETLCLAEAIYIQLRDCELPPSYVQDILALPPSDKASTSEESESSTSNLLKSNTENPEIANDTSLMTVSELNKSSDSPVITSRDSSVDTMEEYEDIEVHCQNSFDLFT